MKEKPLISDLVVYTERLRNGPENLEIFIDAAHLDGDIESVDFIEPIVLLSKTYLAGNDLLFSYEWKGKCAQPCVICNEVFTREVGQEDQYITVFQEEIKCGFFDVFPSIREQIIVHVDAYGECNLGQCPFRKNLQLD